MMRRSKTLANVKWMVVCKTVQSLLQLIVGMMTARYLGPANYGLINYAKSIVAFAMPFVQLGLDATMVKELIDHPEEEGKIVGTSLVAGVVSGLVWIVLIGGFVAFVNPNEPETFVVCLLYSVSMVFQAVALIQYWYQSKLLAKYPAVMQLITYVLVSLYKIYLLVVEASVNWFALAYSMEFGLIGFSLLLIYKRKMGSQLDFSFALAKKIISRSHPYIWAALMVTVFQNTDHVMLKMMIGNEENGYYTAAITAVGVCQYVYIAIIDTMRPVIITERKQNGVRYEQKIAQLYGIVCYLSFFQGIVFTAFANVIVDIMYGKTYVQAVPVVRVLVWSVSFSFMGMIRNVWILAEEKQSCLWKINLAGVLINIGLNWVMIPWAGALGAAIASLMTQIGMNFALGFVVPLLRNNNRYILRGCNPKFLAQSICNDDLLKKKL